MSNTGDIGKKARREHAREIARQEREAAKRRQKRNRLFLQGGIVVAVLAVVAVIVVVVASSTSVSSVSPKNMASDGILFTGDGSTVAPVKTAALEPGEDPVATDSTDAAVSIVTYIDYACPICQSFEAANAEQITGWVAQGAATLEIHPISILDRVSLGTKYSSRAANAAVCVANYEPDQYMAVNDALFAGQPEENTSGLDTAALKTLVADAGADSDEVASCISDKTFADWVTTATDRVTDGELASDTVTEFVGTPTVLVNGELYQGSVTDAEAFAAFVAQVAAA